MISNKGYVIKCCSCDYWIHDNIKCYNYDLKHGKSCPDCYHTEMSIVEDNINQGKININHRKYNADDDDISDFNTHLNSDNSEDRSKTLTVVSESCNTNFKKSTKINHLTIHTAKKMNRYQKLLISQIQ